MGMILLAGQRANHLERMATAPTANPAFDANAPVAYLADGIPGAAGRFGSVAANGTITLDKNQLANGGFESELGSEWTDRSVGASNTALRTTTGGEFSEGAAGLECTIVTTGGSNLAGRSQDTYVNAGETIYVTLSRRGDGTRVARARLQDLGTGKYLNTSFSWQTAATDFDTRSTASFATFGPQAVVVEALPVGQPELYNRVLRLTLYVDGSSAGAAYFDAAYVWAGTNFFSAHGHNLGAWCSLELRRDSAGFAGAGTLDTTITSFPQAFYAKLAALRTERYWRMTHTGTPAPTGAPYYGEVVLGQYLAAARDMDPGIRVRFNREQLRSGQRSYLLADRPQRSVTMGFRYFGSAQFEEARDKVLGGSANGHHPLVIVPQDSEPDVIYGRVSPVWQVVRRTAGYVEQAELEIEELPLPTLI